MRKVPNPFPLTVAGTLAALGPQAIYWGITVGGGEVYLLPSVAARGALHLHWLMAVSLVLESVLAYECIKYSACTGRSFFVATADLAPRNVWPWFWAATAILTWAWPAWMGGAVVAAEHLTGISTPKALQAWGLPSTYVWSAIGLVAVLAVFYCSDRTRAFVGKFFVVIMLANLILVLLITLVAAKPDHYWQVLKGYLGVTYVLEGYPTGRLDGTLALALFGQPGGSLMWASFWVVQAAFGMGRYAGPGGRLLRPPDRIVTEEIEWDASDPEERRKMDQWIKLGGYGLVLWWAVLGGLVVTYLYSVAGLAVLHDEFLRTGRFPGGATVPIQMAIIAGGVLGPMAGWLMLLFLVVTLFEAQIRALDTFVGRTTCDAIAVGIEAEKRHPYRVFHFLVVTAVVLAGFYLITFAQPFTMWIGVAISALVYRSIGAWQIWLINHRRLPEGFKVSLLNACLLWITVITGFGAFGYWAVTVLPVEACKQAKLLCP